MGERIEIGASIGHYRIVSKIGAGGMGEVYKAHDSRLDREVAIKMLPSEMSSDEDRLRRFEQEAKATSALNHPNILTVYDIGEYDGSPFIVAELLEGEELRQRLDDGSIPLRKVTEYAQQIVSGLSAAHERGIVHRDLKPENLFITKDERVKILDFGLAKLREPNTNIHGSEDATRRAMTDPGVVMGTVGYMSPEQVRGQMTDHRSDIFSFGLILYEMITGRRAFQEESMAETMSAIVKEEPPEMTESNPNISPSLERIVRRCLEKKPERRFHSAHDLGFALESLGMPTSSGTNLAEAVQTIDTPATTKRGRWRERVAWIAAGVLSLALISLGVAYSRRTVPPAKPVRLFVNPPEKATRFDRPRLSPDNRTLAFVATVADQRQIWLRPLGASTAKPLAGTENVDGLFWSPDSQFIGFSAGGKLNKIALSGGSATTLCPAPVGGLYGDWNQDGTIIFGSVGKGISRISATGGSPADITTVDEAQGEISHSSPAFLPDGRHFFYSVENKDPNKQGIYLSSLDGGDAKLILPTNGRAAAVEAVEDPETPGAGYLLFVLDGALLAQPFDFLKYQPKGEQVRLADQLLAFGAGAVTGNMMVFSEGSLDQRLTWVDPTGKKLGTVGPVGTYGLRDISPDDQRVAATRSDVTTRKQDIWLFDLARGTETRFTIDPADDSWPTWSPNGDRIVWLSDRSRKAGIYMKAANGSGQDELLFESDNPKYPMQWSPDGRFVLYREADPQKGMDLWILPVEGERKPYPWLNTQFDESTLHGFSPDGKWIAYSSSETGRSEIYIQAFVPGEPASGAKWPISNGGGNMPIWRRDGRGLYYFDSKSKIMEVDVTLGSKIVAGVPKELFDIGPLRADMTRAWSMTGDGQRFLFVTRAEDADLSPFTVVLNWMADLKK